MASFNKTMVVGYLGRDPEIRYSAQGTAICDFSVATTEKRKDKNGEMQETTTWFRVSLFGRQAEVASENLKKGSPVYVEGSISLREWTDRDGATRTSLELRASDFQFLPATKDAGNGGGGGGRSEAPRQQKARAGASSKAAPAATEGPIDDDDIPF